MEKSRINEIKARRKAITKGSWEFAPFEAQSQPHWGCIEPLYSNGNNHNPFWLSKHDGQFIVHSITDITALITEIERLWEFLEENACDEAYLDWCHCNEPAEKPK